IDTSTFDSKMYLRRLLQETSPRELLQTANKLVAEARQIDNDMKTMVYENYSKFITATETVQRMVEDADFMDAEMEKLSGRINRIS
ncbi:Vps51/Vps67-domain-containing protein, partial [Coemansia spiralis]